MGVGKYSPTVNTAYAKNQNWWRENGGGNWENGNNGNVDKDGYDAYGYGGEFGDGPDRAGYKECQYGEATVIGEDVYHDLYDEVYTDWTADANGLPCHRLDLPVEGDADVIDDPLSEVSRRINEAKRLQAQADVLNKQIAHNLSGVYAWANKKQDGKLVGKLLVALADVPTYREILIGLKHEIDSEG